MKSDKLENIVSHYISWAPISLVLREVSRIRIFDKIVEKHNLIAHEKILDVGCGDGHWWKYLDLFPLSSINGIDISKKEVEEANRYFVSHCLDVSSSEFFKVISSESYGLIIGNCSLEHVFNIEGALLNIRKVLKPGGTFILFVPAPLWALNGTSLKILRFVSPRLAMSFSGAINGFFQHWHLYHYKIWSALLTSAGFKIDTIYGLGNRKSEFLFRLLLPSALLSFIVKKVSGKYLNWFLHPFVPSHLKKWFTKVILNSLDENFVPPDNQEIYEYIIVCTK